MRQVLRAQPDGPACRGGEVDGLLGVEREPRSDCAISSGEPLEIDRALLEHRLT
jgi:hypothetical protein